MSPERKEVKQEDFTRELVTKPFEPITIKDGTIQEKKYLEEVQEFVQNVAKLGIAGLRGKMMQMHITLLNFDSISTFMMMGADKFPPIPEGIENTRHADRMKLVKQHLKDGTVLKRDRNNLRIYPGTYAKLYTDYKMLMKNYPAAIMMEHDPEKALAELKDWACKGGDFNHDVGAHLFWMKYIVEFLDAAVNGRPPPTFRKGFIRIYELGPLFKMFEKTLDKFNALSESQKLEVWRQFSKIEKMVR